MAGMFGSQYNDTRVMIDDLSNLSQMSSEAKPSSEEGIMKAPKGEKVDTGSWWAWLSGITRQKTQEKIKQVQEELSSMGVDTTGLSPEYQQSMLEGIAQAKAYRDKWGITQSSNAGPVWLEEQGDFPVINEPSSITVTPLDDTTGPMTDMAGLMAPPKSGEVPKVPSPMSKPDIGESEELETPKAESTPSIDTTEAEQVIRNATPITVDTKNKDNVKVLQQSLTDTGYNPKGVDGLFGGNTAKSLKKLQAYNGLKITGKLDDATVDLLNSGKQKVLTTKKVGNLTVGTGYRDDYVNPNKPVISTDFNSTDSKKSKYGVEIILPDNIYNQGQRSPYFRAAQKYARLVADFAAKHGYEDYKIRGNGGARSRSETGRGRSGTIHTEPFFQQDTKMVDIINSNKEEFFDLYIKAFKDVDATLVAPHGSINKDNQFDPGAISETLGSERDFGGKGIAYIMGKY